VLPSYSVLQEKKTITHFEAEASTEASLTHTNTHTIHTHTISILCYPPILYYRKNKHSRILKQWRPQRTRSSSNPATMSVASCESFSNEFLCVCVCLCVCVRDREIERESVCLCVCVCLYMYTYLYIYIQKCRGIFRLFASRISILKHIRFFFFALVKRSNYQIGTATTSWRHKFSLFFCKRALYM